MSHPNVDGFDEEDTSNKNDAMTPAYKAHAGKKYHARKTRHQLTLD